MPLSAGKCRPSRALQAAGMAMLCAWTWQAAGQGLGAAAGAAASALAVAQNAAPSTVDHLHGLVVNSVTGKPVARVLVTSMGTQGLAVMTDDQGRFAFDVRRPVEPAEGISGAGSTILPNLNLSFQLRRPGYIARSVTALLPLYSPSTPDPELVSKITPAALITGHIATDSGVLPSSLTVQLRRKRIIDGGADYLPVASIQPDGNGDFRFAELEPGDFKVSTAASVDSGRSEVRGQGAEPASVPGLLPAFYPEATSLDSAPPIHLGPGETFTADLNLRSATFYRVTIPVSAPEGGGVSALLVPSDGGFTLGYDRREGAIGGLLPSGTYTLQVTGAGSPFAGRGGQGQGGPGAAARSIASITFNVEGKPVLTNPVALHPAPEIPIVVRREFTSQDSSQAAQQIAQTARSPVSISVLAEGNSFPLGNSEPDGNGGLRLRNVREGTYDVRATPMSGGYVAALSCAGVDLLREPLVVSSGGTTGPIEVTLRDDSATLNVDVTGDTVSSPTSPAAVAILAVSLDSPQRQAYTTIQVVHPSAYLVSPVAASAPGVLANMAPGRYLVLAQTKGTAPIGDIEYRNPKVLEELASKGTEVTLSAGQKTEISVPIIKDEGQD